MPADACFHVALQGFRHAGAGVRFLLFTAIMI